MSASAFNYYTAFKYCGVTGTSNGHIALDSCSIDGLSEFYGIAEGCTISGTLTLSSDNTQNAVITDLMVGNVPGPPTINCNGDGAKLSLSCLTGPILITNKTGATQKIFIDLYSGRVGFDSTVTAGNISVRGVGYIYQDDSTNTTFDVTGLMSKDTVADAVLDTNLSIYTAEGTLGSAISTAEYGGVIYIDTVNGESGSVFPVGTWNHPVDNIADAVSISANYEIKTWHFHGAATIPSGTDISYKIMEGHYAEPS